MGKHIGKKVWLTEGRRTRPRMCALGWDGYEGWRARLKEGKALTGNMMISVWRSGSHNQKKTGIKLDLVRKNQTAIFCYWQFEVGCSYSCINFYLHLVMSTDVCVSSPWNVFFFFFFPFFFITHTTVPLCVMVSYELNKYGFHHASHILMNTH